MFKTHVVAVLISAVQYAQPDALCDKVNRCKNRAVDWWPRSEADWLNFLLQVAISSAGVGVAVRYYLD